MCENESWARLERGRAIHAALHLVRWFTNRAPGKTRAAATGAPAEQTRPGEPPTTAPMTDTPGEPEPGTDVDLQETPVDGSLTLARFPPELLVLLAEALGNPLVLLVSKAHLSKAFREAAGNAQATLTRADLDTWSGTVDDAVVAAVVSKSILLFTLSLRGCDQITNAALVAVASRYPLLTTLNLAHCHNITNAAVVAVAWGCPQLTTLELDGCDKITDAAVVAVASRCKRLTTLDLSGCDKITDAAVVMAVASECKQLTTLDLMYCRITDAAVVAVASGCPLLTTLKLGFCRKITDEAVVAVASGCKLLTKLSLCGCINITDAAVVTLTSGRPLLTMMTWSACLAAVAPP